LLDAGASADDAQAIYNMHFLSSDKWLELLLARGLSSAPDLEFLLGQAAVQGFVERVRLLLARGTAADGHNRYNGRTHVENALLEGHGEIARMLLAAGARPPTLSDNDRFRVAVLANDAAEATRILAEAASAEAASANAEPDALLAEPHALLAEPDALIAAARHGRLDAIRLGLDLGLPVDGRDDNGLTPLHHAARSGHLDVVRELVARGASLALRDPVYDGTPLGHAQHFTSRWPRVHGDEIIALLEQSARP
jgi:ankyrin repeat protein